MHDADWTPKLEDDEIVEYIRRVGGSYALDMARFIQDHEPVDTETVLAHYPDRPSEVRKVLYALMEARVAEYETDVDKGGWETFRWRLSLNEVKHAILRWEKEHVEELRRRLAELEDKTFFACPDGHATVPFEEAFDAQFHCPECQAPMNEVDSAREQERLRGELATIEKEAGAEPDGG